MSAVVSALKPIYMPGAPCVIPCADTLVKHIFAEHRGIGDHDVAMTVDGKHIPGCAGQTLHDAKKTNIQTIVWFEVLELSDKQ